MADRSRSDMPLEIFSQSDNNSTATDTRIYLMNSVVYIPVAALILREGGYEAPALTKLVYV